MVTSFTESYTKNKGENKEGENVDIFLSELKDLRTFDICPNTEL